MGVGDPAEGGWPRSKNWLVVDVKYASAQSSVARRVRPFVWGIARRTMLASLEDRTSYERNWPVGDRVFTYPKSVSPQYADTLEVLTWWTTEEALDPGLLRWFGNNNCTPSCMLNSPRTRVVAEPYLCHEQRSRGESEKAKLRLPHLCSAPADQEWERGASASHVPQAADCRSCGRATPVGRAADGRQQVHGWFPMVQGFQENAEFFDLTYEDPETVRLDMAFAAIAPLLWMRAGSQGRRIEEPTDDYGIAETYGVLFSIDASGPFLKEVADRDGLRCAFIVTDDERQFQMIATELPENVEAVRLYESYLRTFEIGGVSSHALRPQGLPARGGPRGADTAGSCTQTTSTSTTQTSPSPCQPSRVRARRSSLRR